MDQNICDKCGISLEDYWDWKTRGVETARFLSCACCQKSEIYPCYITKNTSRVDALLESELEQPERGTLKFARLLEQCTELGEEVNNDVESTEIATLLMSETACFFRPKKKEDSFLDLVDVRELIDVKKNDFADVYSHLEVIHLRTGTPERMHHTTFLKLWEKEKEMNERYAGVISGIFLLASEGKLDRVQFIDDINYLTDPLSGVDLILLQKESFWCDSDRDGAKCWIILVQGSLNVYLNGSSDCNAGPSHNSRRMKVGDHGINCISGSVSLLATTPSIVLIGRYQNMWESQKNFVGGSGELKYATESQKLKWLFAYCSVRVPEDRFMTLARPAFCFYALHFLLPAIEMVNMGVPSTAFTARVLKIVREKVMPLIKFVMVPGYGKCIFNVSVEQWNLMHQQFVKFIADWKPNRKAISVKKKDEDCQSEDRLPASPSPVFPREQDITDTESHVSVSHSVEDTGTCVLTLPEETATSNSSLTSYLNWFKNQPKNLPIPLGLKSASGLTRSQKRKLLDPEPAPDKDHREPLWYTDVIISWVLSNLPTVLRKVVIYIVGKTLEEKEKSRRKNKCPDTVFDLDRLVDPLLYRNETEDLLQTEGVAYQQWTNDVYELCNRLLQECDFLVTPISCHFDAETVDNYFEKYNHQELNFKNILPWKNLSIAERNDNLKMHVKLRNQRLIDYASVIPPRFRGLVKELLWKLITQRAAANKDRGFKICQNVTNYIQAREQWLTNEEQAAVETGFNSMFKEVVDHQTAEKPLSELWTVSIPRFSAECILETQSINGSWQPSLEWNNNVKEAARSGGYKFGMAVWAAIWSSEGELPADTRPLHYLEDLYRSRIVNPIAVRDSMLNLKKYALELTSPLRLRVVQRDGLRENLSNGDCEIVSSNY